MCVFLVLLKVSVYLCRTQLIYDIMKLEFNQMVANFIDNQKSELATKYIRLSTPERIEFVNYIDSNFGSVSKDIMKYLLKHS